MNNTITHFFGRALTGQGLKTLYKEMLDEADEVYVFKDAYGFQLAQFLQRVGLFYSEQGFNIDYFQDPLFKNVVEATFAKGPNNKLFLLSATPSIENDPRTTVISLAHCLDQERLASNQAKLAALTNQKNEYHEKCFQSLAEAIHLHDDWEVETRRYMDWRGLDQQTEQLFRDIFGDTILNKEGSKIHRLLGTLTPNGASDTVQSITQNLERRLFIKGYPGTGKSSMMKKLADEAVSRGYDAQLIWCGLDANSIDMVILPELKFCIFDSTEPHIYYPERKGDEIFDMAKHCRPTEVELTNIERIVAKYRATMADAAAYAKSYAEVEKEIREIWDEAIIDEKFEAELANLV